MRFWFNCQRMPAEELHQATRSIQGMHSNKRAGHQNLSVPGTQASAPLCWCAERGPGIMNLDQRGTVPKCTESRGHTFWKGTENGFWICPLISFPHRYLLTALYNKQVTNSEHTAGIKPSGVYSFIFKKEGILIVSFKMWLRFQIGFLNFSFFENSKI